MKRRLPLVLELLLAACAPATSHLSATEPPADTVCTLDGMALGDVPGPKAQLRYADGTLAWFCSTAELFAELRGARAVAAIYVQDMAKAAWGHPRGHWIDARTAWYVAGSRAQGSMGPTLASFANQQDAAAFAAREGGRVLSFKQLAAGAAGGSPQDHAPLAR